MKLLLIRHGESGAVGQNGVTTDEQRELTEVGVEKSRRAATALNRMDIRLEAILTSPYPRAVRTAQLLCEGLHHTPQLRERDSLRPCDAIDDAVREIEMSRELRTIAICGHEPTLSAVADHLLGSRQGPSLIFHTGSIAFMQLDVSRKRPEGVLFWFLDSHHLDLISQSP